MKYFGLLVFIFCRSISLSQHIEIGNNSYSLIESLGEYYLCQIEKQTPVIHPIDTIAIFDEITESTSYEIDSLLTLYYCLELNPNEINNGQIWSIKAFINEEIFVLDTFKAILYSVENSFSIDGKSTYFKEFNLSIYDRSTLQLEIEKHKINAIEFFDFSLVNESNNQNKIILKGSIANIRK